MKPSEVLLREETKPRWVVEEVLSRGSLVVLAGEPGVGKSVLAYQLAFCVAAGLPFLAHPVERARVLYYDVENARQDFEQYCRWVWEGLGCPPTPELDAMLQLEHFTLAEDWEPSMLATAATFKPGLIVIDTATPALAIKDENDNAEATRRVRGLRRVQHAAANETTILVLKHEKIHEEGYRRTVRGAKAWLGMADAIMYHTRYRGRARRDGLYRTTLEPDKSRAFGLKTPIRIDPSWAGKGLILKAIPAGASEEIE
jgi:RecA-family ATPase